MKMQSGKNAAASVKETAANVLASANSGMEKTKATVQEKVFSLFFISICKILILIQNFKIRGF